MKKLLLVLLLATVARAQNTTAVTATLLTPAQVAVTKDAFVRFELRNYGLYVPVVTGFNVILPSFIDAYPDATGVVTTNLFSNDKIFPANTYYSVCFYKNGTKFYCCNVVITGTTFNMDNAQCLNATSTPAAVAPCVYCDTLVGPAGPTGPTGPQGPPGPGGGAPAPPQYSVQFNNPLGTFDGDANFTFHPPYYVDIGADVGGTLTIENALDLTSSNDNTLLDGHAIYLNSTYGGPGIYTIVTNQYTSPPGLNVQGTATEVYDSIGGATIVGGIFTTEHNSGVTKPTARAVSIEAEQNVHHKADYLYGFYSLNITGGLKDSAHIATSGPGTYNTAHDYAIKVERDGQFNPGFYVYPTGDIWTRGSINLVTGTTVGACTQTVGVGLWDCTSALSSAGNGPPSTETIRVKICANGVVDTFDWTTKGVSPSCLNPTSMQAGTPIHLTGDGVKITWTVATGHTIGDEGTIVATVAKSVISSASGSPVGSCFAGSLYTDIANTTNTLWVCEAGTWVGK